MNPTIPVYLAGCIVSEIDHRFGPLTPGCVNNCSTLPNRLPIHLRHVWDKATKDKAIAAMLEDFDPPTVPASTIDQGSFWIGYYHQKTARDLPADFPSRLIALRERANLTSYALAQLAGIGLPMLRRMELGERRPSWDSVQKLAAALGVSTEAFRDKVGA